MKKYIMIIALVVVVVTGLIMVFGNGENSTSSRAVTVFTFDSSGNSIEFPDENEDALIEDVSCAEIIPLEKVVINDISLPFGMPRNEVEALIGRGEAFKDFVCYFDEIHIYYDRDDCIEFIEFVGGADGKIQPEIYGVSAFQVKADELVALLSEKNNGAVRGTADGYDLAFMELSAGVYRESTPEDAASIIEASKDDEYSEIDTEEEWKKAEHWATIGAGTEGYYEKYYGEN